MIAEGIYNPVTGETVKVQGAGTVYNEDKNSIALGNNTIAGGNDQFVFGRVNSDDASKAEVVGAGEMMPYNAGYKYFQWKNSQDYTFVDYKIGETKQELEQYLSAVKGTTVTVQDWNDNIKSVYRSQKNSGSGLWIEVDVTNKELTSGDSLYIVEITSNTPSLSGTPSSLTMNDMEKIALAYDSTYYNNYKLYKAPEYLKGEITMVRKPSNIRTLDWSGNEKLAGGLEIGGTLKIGSTTITGTQLAALLELLD